MRDGTFKIFFEDGKTVGVFINSGLDSIYKSVFLKSQKRLAEKNDNLELNVACIVFGCFWLEASCNTHIQSVLEYRGTTRAKNLRGFDQAIREIVTRGKFLQKLDLLATFANPSLKKRFQKLRPAAKKLFELRNRLAHFKDNDEEIHRGPISEVKLIELLRHPREPKLISELRDVRKKCRSIVALGAWLNQIQREWGKINGNETSKNVFSKKNSSNELIPRELSEEPN